MRVLLVGSAGSLLYPVVAGALTRAGVTVVRGHSAADQPLHSRHYADYLAHPPTDDAAAFESFILGFAKAHGDTVLLPCSDAALIALQPIRPKLDRLMPVAAAPPEATAIALDKSLTLDVAAGLRDSLHPPLVQMAVQFDIQRKFHLYYLFDHTGRLRSWYGQRNIAEQCSVRLGPSSQKIPGGVALLWESTFDEEVLMRGRRLMEAIGWHGLGFIEGAYDKRDGKPYLFEINARIGGTQALSLQQGVNFAYDACLVALGRTPPERLTFKPGVRAKRDPFTLLGTWDPALMLRVVDPTWVSSIPGLSDPRPVLEATWRGASRWWKKRR